MDIKLNKLLDRFSLFKLKDQELRQTVVGWVCTKFGEEIDPSSVKVSEGKIFIKTNTTLKSIIFMHQTELLKTLNRLPKTNIKEIR